MRFLQKITFFEIWRFLQKLHFYQFLLVRSILGAPLALPHKLSRACSCKTSLVTQSLWGSARGAPNSSNPPKCRDQHTLIWPKSGNPPQPGFQESALVWEGRMHLRSVLTHGIHEKSRNQHTRKSYFTQFISGTHCTVRARIRLYEYQNDHF